MAATRAATPGRNGRWAARSMRPSRCGPACLIYLPDPAAPAHGAQHLAQPPLCPRACICLAATLAIASCRTCSLKMYNRNACLSTTTSGTALASSRPSGASRTGFCEPGRPAQQSGAGPRSRQRWRARTRWRSSTSRPSWPLWSSSWQTHRLRMQPGAPTEIVMMVTRASSRWRRPCWMKNRAWQRCRRPAWSRLRRLRLRIRLHLHRRVHRRLHRDSARRQRQHRGSATLSKQILVSARCCALTAS
eukprot:SAG22_NODE_641_length_8235_cov_9.502704_4_plen_247_part_00